MVGVTTRTRCLWWTEEHQREARHECKLTYWLLAWPSVEKNIETQHTKTNARPTSGVMYPRQTPEDKERYNDTRGDPHCNMRQTPSDETNTERKEKHEQTVTWYRHRKIATSCGHRLGGRRTQADALMDYVRENCKEHKSSQFGFYDKCRPNRRWISGWKQCSSWLGMRKTEKRNI